ncbi:Sel1 domain protein repeat-containing protein [Shewanella sediminis HAW-EB3]|uniref:Sel1 domain protein repeat-containing protein n=1 Tax=Shewanella sediminis (strain HAW-EB3) TaxID=425104 RepID=A8FPU0_SHESH|nr:tetratricopeptide repeat protein [Shewanella sediminis]ABV34863.1 Sel1 domain protein repeat-containing protein [Shewanella sediminis HAW-EB3]
MLTDVEFVTQFSTELGHDYGVAKSYVRDVPTQALLQIRSFTHKLTELLAKPKRITFDSPNLYDRIEMLNRKRVINVRTTRALHKLRGDGNRGAHPEKYHLTSEQLLELSEKSIEKLLSLVASLFTQVTTNPLPEYRFEAFDSFAGRDLCYRAVMESDPQAQYLVGMSLKTKALMQREQEQALAEPEEEQGSPPDKFSDSTFKKAEYWFTQAADSNMDALYESGVALIHGYSGKVDIAAGEQVIAAAAEANVANAMALLGYFHLVGGESIKLDSDKALHYLQLAADLEQSEAIANLGVLFYQRGDLEKAKHFIAKAAQAGFPHAQYHLALMLARGEGCDADSIAGEQWMAEAAEQGQVDAMLARAQSMLNDDNAFGCDLSQAELYLREAIKYGHSVPAMIELSIALADGMLGKIDVVGSAALLKLARERSNPQELAVIEPLWESLSLQVENVLSMTDNTDEVASLQRAKELLS